MRTQSVKQRRAHNYLLLELGSQVLFFAMLSCNVKFYPYSFERCVCVWLCLHTE